MLVKDDEGEKNIVINRPIENRQDGLDSDKGIL